MAASRLGSGLGAGMVVVCTLAGCNAQALGPPREAGAPPPTVSRPPSNVVGADGGAGPVAGDGATPPPSAAAATDGGPAVRLATQTTVLSSAYLLDADALAADSDGIYWVTADNHLWMLATGLDSPSLLAFESTGPPAQLTAYPGVLLAAGAELFWVAKVSNVDGSTRQTIHRTRKGVGDDILVTNLQSDSVQGVAVDDQYLYWTQDLSPGYAGGAQILALPREADPGTTPVPLVTVGGLTQVFSLAVDDQYLYWTPWAAIGSTVYRATVWRGDKAGLLAGTTGGALFVDLPGTVLWPQGGALYFVYDATLWTSAVARADATNAFTTLPIEPGSLTFLGDCVVTSTAVPGMSPKVGFIYAAPLGAGASAGGAESAGIEIAANVAVPPAVGVPGLVFVDGTGQLLAISPADLRAALAAAPP